MRRKLFARRSEIHAKSPSNSTTKLLFFVCVSLLANVMGVESADAGLRAKCQSAAATKSCSECIKQNPECAWCADTRSNVSARCDLKSEFEASGACAKQHIYSPANEVKIAPQHNLPLGGRRPDSVTPIQLEPQQAEVRLKPGDVVEVPFQYLHKAPASGYEVKDFTIQTSEFQSLGLQIEFSIDCHGERKSGRICPGIGVEEKVTFFAKISLKDCANRNLIAVSVGIYGYNTVSAIFVTPLCGCECENPRFQEKRSPRCGYAGNLVCGVCACDAGRGGERCECELDKFGVSSADDLVNQCRENEKAPVCSAKGKCSCGRCTCDADFIRGRFCECDSGACPLNVEGRMCSGRGECRCGKCACESGFTGDDCACTDDQTPCTENGVTCSGNGFCECGKCACNSGWTGATCSVERAEDGDDESKAADETSTSSSSSSSSTEGGADDGEESAAAEDVLPSDEGGGGEHAGQRVKLEGKESGEEEDDSAAPDAALVARPLSILCWLSGVLTLAFCRRALL